MVTKKKYKILVFALKIIEDINKNDFFPNFCSMISKKDGCLCSLFVSDHLNSIFFLFGVWSIECVHKRNTLASFRDSAFFVKMNKVITVSLNQSH